jgi:hypothetical protein
MLYKIKLTKKKLMMITFLVNVFVFIKMKWIHNS